MASVLKFDEWQNSAGATRSTVLKTYYVSSAQQTQTSSYTFVIANPFSITVTPFSTSSKFLLLAHNFSYTNISTAHACATFYRNSTNLGNAYGMSNFYTQNGGYTEYPHAMTYVDAPNTTAAITYAIYIRINGAGNSMVWGDATNRMGNFTIMEIAG